MRIPSAATWHGRPRRWRCCWGAMASRGGQSVAHVMRVKKLYRHGLKLLMNWTVHRDLWIEKGNELRAQFEANRSVQGQMNIERLVRAGEQKLKEHAHPDPYKREWPPLPLGASPAPPRHRVSWHSPPHATPCHPRAPTLATKSPRTRRACSSGARRASSDIVRGHQVPALPQQQ